MPYGRSPDVIEEVQKTAYRFVLLYEFESPEGGWDYAVSSNAKVTVGGITYWPTQIRLQTVGHEGGVQVSRTRIVVDNTDLASSLTVEAEKYDGKEVRIYVHFPDIPDSKELLFRGNIESFSVNPTQITADLLASADYLVFSVPRRRFQTRCPWTYKGPECGYTGAETSCTKTYDGCYNKGRFGGFPYIHIS